jgi:outer membrane receptor protein involved in Fe transport
MTRRTSINPVLSAAVALVLAGASQPGRAEGADDGQQSGGAGRATVLEEVVVTATRRSENLQEVPISVTALGEQSLKLGGIDDISRVDYLVPGMRFGQSGDEVRLAMRGTRTNNVGTEAEQVVGIFEDGVYVPTTTQALGSYVDVNRIEVLRGPQGTLYGRNTFGGTINIITNEPDLGRAGADLEALYGDYNRTRLQAVLNVPAGETFALRLAALRDKHDGYIINTYRAGSSDDLNDLDLKFFRATARWQPTDVFDATLRFAYSDKTGNGSAIWGYQQIAGYIGGVLVPGHQFAPPDASDHFDQGPWKVARNQRSIADESSKSGTLTLNYDMSFATLKLVGNYTKFDGDQNYDSDYSDGGDPNNNGFTGWKSRQDTWSVEAQLASTGEGPLSWLLGYYTYRQTAAWNWQSLEDGQFTTPYWDYMGDYTSDSKGIFGNATYSLTDKIRVNAGLRYAKDDKKTKDQLDWSVFPPVVIPNSGTHGSWSKTLWKVGLDADVSEGVMGYVSASTGYRAGGFNFVAPDVPLTYGPETVTAYEVGLKSELADRTVVLNVAAYLNQYRNMQAQSFVVLGGNATEFTENGGEVNAKGLEAELRWRPGENWHIDANMAFMDAKFGTYNVSKVAGLGDLGGRQDLGNPDAPLLSLKGWRPALSPTFTAALQLGYDFGLGDRGTLTPYLQSSYSGRYAAYDFNIPGVYQDAYVMTDLRLIWAAASGKWQVQGYVLNAGDKAVLNRVVVFNPVAGADLASLQANWGNPRTWGLSAAYRY